MDTDEATSSDYDEQPSYKRLTRYNFNHIDPNEHLYALEQEGRERMQRDQHDNDQRYEI